MKELTEYYVADLLITDHFGWTSIHRTNQGAQEKLVAKANEYGIRVTRWTELWDCPGVESIGISYLPVEE